MVSSERLSSGELLAEARKQPSFNLAVCITLKSLRRCNQISDGS